MGYKKESKICLYCEKEFLGIKTSKYCCTDCSHNARKKRKILVCKQCNIEFEVQDYRDAKFCSYECKNNNQMSEIIDIECDQCNVIFSRKLCDVNDTRNFCDKKCSDLFHMGKNHYEWKEYLHIDGRKDALRKWGKAVKLADNYICQHCGNSEKSIQHAHHIISKSEDPSKEFDETNGITLCIYCHFKVHEGNEKAQRLINQFIKNYEIYKANNAVLNTTV